MHVLCTLLTFNLHGILQSGYQIIRDPVSHNSGRYGLDKRLAPGIGGQ